MRQFVDKNDIVGKLPLREGRGAVGDDFLRRRFPATLRPQAAGLGPPSELF